MNINQYKNIQLSEKIQFLNSLALQLGKEWSVDNKFLSYNPTQELFAFIPGGTMTMGFSVSDIFQLCKARGEKYKKEEWSWAPNIQTARPATAIQVYPFLIAIKHSNSIENIEAPFHLPSEAEVEWLLRNGGQTGFPGISGDKEVTKSNRNKLICALEEHFGVEEFVNDIDTFGQQCEDSEHQTYHGRPLDSTPWGRDQGVKRIVHTTWQDDAEEIIAWHAADRQLEKGGRKRKTLRLTHLVNDVKAEIEADSLDQLIMDSLLAGKGADFNAAWASLQLLAHAPAQDMHPLLRKLLREYLTPESKNKLDILQWLFTLGYGHTPEQLFKNQDAYSQDRREIREVISTEIDRLIPFLSDKKAEVRSQAALILSMATSESNKVQAVLESQFNLEKKAEVKETLAIALALLTRKPLNPVLIEKNKISETIDELIKAITGKADKQKIVSLIKSQDTLPYFDWFIYLLSTGEKESQENTQAAMELAKYALNTENREKRMTCLDVSLSLLFEKKRPLLLPEQISPAQKELIELLTPETPFEDKFFRDGLLKKYQIPDHHAAREIILGRKNDNAFAKIVEYAGRSMPILCAVDHAFCENKMKGVEEVLKSITLIDIVQLRHEFPNHIKSFRWPYHFGNDASQELMETISSASEEQRAALCEWLKPRLVEFFQTSYLYNHLTEENSELLAENERKSLYYLEYYYAAAENDDFKKSFSEKFLTKLLTEEIHPSINQYKLLPVEKIASDKNYEVACRLLEKASSPSTSYRQATFLNLALATMFSDKSFFSDGYRQYKLLPAGEYTNYQKKIIPDILKLLETVSLNFKLISYSITKTSLQIVSNSYQGLLAKVITYNGITEPLYFALDKKLDVNGKHDDVPSLLDQFNSDDQIKLKKEVAHAEWRFYVNWNDIFR